MKHLWLLALVILIASCKSKPKALTDDQTITTEDFIDFFPEFKLPFNISDTSALFRKHNDSATIGNKIFTQILGDSVLKPQFGNTKPKIYIIGRVPVKKAETYLFVKAISASKKAVYVLTFDKEKKFKAALPMMVVDVDPLTQQTAGMDARYSIARSRHRKAADGKITYRKEVYVYNNIGVYTLILTESNDDLAVTGDVVNPIDTLDRKHKYAGDYVRDKRNIVSIRDGAKGSQVRFFIHFEKDKGACRGEMRGIASFVQPNVAEFRESGDPCVLQLRFANNSVTLQEVAGCGNYRDIKCFFEGSFPKKKVTKPAPPKKK